MNDILSRLNQKKRSEKRIIQTECIIRKREKLLHVCLNSVGCRYRKCGSCTMCDYGQGTNLNSQSIDKVISQIESAAINVNSILIGTLGSVFDTEEISLHILDKICEMLNDLPINTIIFETHYTFVSVEICEWIRKRLPQKDVVIEMGLESVDLFVQTQCLNKKIDLEMFKNKIQILHEYGFSVTVNAFLGAPFLSKMEQIDDTEKTINWAIKNYIDSVVIFPANIRKNTFLHMLYQVEKYEELSQWSVFEVLDRIPTDYLNRIYLAWYGDWIDIENDEQNNLPPKACEKCKPIWKKFYHEFLSCFSSKGRRKILDEYKNRLTEKCDCRKKFKDSLQKSYNEKNRSTSVKKILEDLEMSFL